MGSNIVDIHSLPPPSTEPTNIIGQSNNISKYLSPQSLFYDLPKATKLLAVTLVIVFILSHIYYTTDDNVKRYPIANLIGLIPGLFVIL